MSRRMVLCPGCGGWKSLTAQRCRSCAGMPTPTYEVQHDPRRLVDFDLQTRSDWRPPHMSPACPTCRGFGSVQGAQGETGTEVEYRRKTTARAASDLVPGRRQVTALRTLRDRGSRAGGWHECPDCIGHPGSVMTHASWMEVRGG